jgi:hypothetical protein
MWTSLTIVRNMIVKTSLTSEESITIVGNITYNGKEYHLQG